MEFAGCLLLLNQPIMISILTCKSLLVCSFLFVSFIDVKALSLDHFSKKHLDRRVPSDTSSMLYYSFQHQKTIKYKELLSESGVSFISTCVGREIVLTAPDYGENAKYSWEGPNGFTSATKEVKFENVQLINDGTYLVTVIEGNLTVTGKIKLIVRPMPKILVNKDNFPENEPIQIQAGDSMLNAKYEWRNMDKKVVSKSKDLWISPKEKGTYSYRLTVNKDGCEISKNIDITVGDEESKPLYNNTVEVLRHSYK